VPEYREGNGLVRRPVSAVDVRANPGSTEADSELWHAWRLAQGESGRALQEWYSASKGQKERTHAAYTAALELEELAALELEITFKWKPLNTAESLGGS
jgi:hypothetical protein